VGILNRAYDQLLSKYLGKIPFMKSNLDFLLAGTFFSFSFFDLAAGSSTASGISSSSVGIIAEAASGSSTLAVTENT
jgi:hypothetical protein